MAAWAAKIISIVMFNTPSDSTYCAYFTDSINGFFKYYGQLLHAYAAGPCDVSLDGLYDGTMAIVDFTQKFYPSAAGSLVSFIAAAAGAAVCSICRRHPPTEIRSSSTPMQPKSPHPAPVAVFAALYIRGGVHFPRARPPKDHL
jgi:hypothetical protein